MLYYKVMKILRAVAICAGLSALVGCADIATTRNFATMGTLLGTGAGIAIGAATGDIAQGAMLGAGLGGLAGAAAGDQLQTYQRKRSGKKLMEEVERDILGQQGTVTGLDTGTDKLVKESKWVDTSRVKRVWVEDKVVDGKLVEAHFEQRLIPSGYWVEEEKKVWADGQRSNQAPL
jgi:hypothetical protein